MPFNETTRGEEPRRYDLVIVGAGITGATLGIRAAKSGLSVALIDAGVPHILDRSESKPRNHVDAFSSRVSAITPANFNWLAELGVWPRIDSQHVQPYQKMQVWEELGGGKICFDADEYHCPALGYIVENHVLLDACIKETQTYENLDALFDIHIDEMRHDAQSNIRRLVLSDGRVLETGLVVGADGANSFVRRVLNITTREWDYQQCAIVCTVQTEQSHQNTAWQRFSESGPVAYLPLKGEGEDSLHDAHFCSIVWSLDTARAREVLALDDDAFRAALARELEMTLGKVVAVSQRSHFPLRQRHAKSYSASQAVLIGDAAHTIHPLAGQGLNLGLSDARALGDILADAKGKEYSLSHPVLLARYQRLRQSENMGMMLGMEGFKWLFGARDPMLRLIRNIGVGQVNKHTLIKRQIALKAMGLSI